MTLLKIHHYKFLSTAAFLAVLSFGFAVKAQAVQTVTGTYQGLNNEISGTCSSTYNIWGQEPDGPGPFPVHIHVVGTNEPFKSSYAQEVITQMVS